MVRSPKRSSVIHATAMPRAEAVTYLTETYGADSEAVDWAKTLPVESFDALVQRYGRPA